MLLKIKKKKNKAKGTAGNPSHLAEGVRWGWAVKDSCRMDEVGSLETSFLMQINSIL